MKMKPAVSWMRTHLSAISLADIQKHLAKITILASMAALLIYLAIFNQPRYMSESRVAIKRSDGLDNGNLNSGLPLDVSNPSSAEDALYLKEHINSPDVLVALDKQLNFREVLSHSGLDFLDRPSKDETVGGFLKYYKDRINTSYDNKTELLNIRTQGFNPEFASEFDQTVLKESECFINGMSHRIARDQFAFAGTETEKARQRLGTSEAELLSYQDNGDVLDPQIQAQAASTLVDTLMDQKVQTGADLRNLLTYLREDAPQVVSACNAIQSLRVQINEEKGKVTASQGDKLSRMTVDFEETRPKVEFSIGLYRLILTSIEKTRVEAARRLRVSSVISSPQLPQESPSPNIPYLIICWLLVCRLLLSTLKLLLVVVKDY